MSDKMLRVEEAAEKAASRWTSDHSSNQDTPETDKLSAKLYNESPNGSLTDRGMIVAGELADHARLLEKKCRAMKTALEKAESVFDNYAALHNAKGTAESLFKAQTNQQHAEDIRAVLLGYSTAQ